MPGAQVLQGLLFKEWIKLRLAAWLPFLLLLLGLLDAWQQMRGLKSAAGGAALWEQVLVRDKLYFEHLRYLPAFAGAWWAAAQWWPECRDHRLRLFFHLPVREQRALAVVAGIGLALLALLTAALCASSAAISAAFLPWEAARMTALTVLPWCLAGIVTYAATAGMLIERRPLRRLWHGLVGAAFVLLLCGASGHGRHIDHLPAFALLAGLWLLPLPALLDRARRGGAC